MKEREQTPRSIALRAKQEALRLRMLTARRRERHKLLPPPPDLDYDAILDAIRDGRIRHREDAKRAWGLL